MKPVEISGLKCKVILEGDNFNLPEVTAIAPGVLAVKRPQGEKTPQISRATIFFYGLGRWKSYHLALGQLSGEVDGISHYSFQVENPNDFLRDMGMALCSSVRS